MTLVILAAGMGSRYGGMKQIDPINDDGDFIIDFSIYDAIKTGFNKVALAVSAASRNEERNAHALAVCNIVFVEFSVIHLFF